MAVSTSLHSGGLPSQSFGHRLFPAGQLVPFILVTALFFLWGIPNNLNDILIRQFMKSFEITRFNAGLVQSSFYLGYFFLSMPACVPAFLSTSIPRMICSGSAMIFSPGKSHSNDLWCTAIHR